MATSHDFDDTMPFVAPTGGATAGTIIVEATSLKAVLPMTTAISGVEYTAKVRGRVNGVTKSSATAFTALAPLTIKTDGVAYAASAAGIINAYAYGAAASGAASMDVVLVPPISVV